MHLGLFSAPEKENNDIIDVYYGRSNIRTLRNRLGSWMFIVSGPLQFRKVHLTEALKAFPALWLIAVASDTEVR